MAHIGQRVFCGADADVLAWWSSDGVEGCLSAIAAERTGLLAEVYDDPIKVGRLGGVGL